MATKAEKVAIYTGKKEAALERIKLLEKKIVDTKAVVVICDKKIASATDDPAVPEKKEKA